MWLESLKNIKRKDCRPESLSPLVLAYIGDTVYDLYVRTKLIFERDDGPHGLHMRAVGFVCAKAQAEAFRRMEDKLAPEELAVYKRGRNARKLTVPKNAEVADYNTASGLEALIGYLYLCEKTARLEELLSLATKAVPNGCMAGKDIEE
ncbi:MAG: Mini-ribonuclease 3 [Christensenellales bacterium]